MRFIFKTSYEQDIRLARHGGQVFWYGLLALALIAAPFALPEYWLAQLTFVLIYGIAVLGLMLLAGFTGQFSLGHAAFLGVGAYTQAVLTNAGWPFPLAMACAAALAAIVGCYIHPINNRRILQHLRHTFGADEAQINAWCGTWIAAGFDAIEALLARDDRRGDFCHGGAPSLADVYLVPQVESARRFGVDLARWPLISAVDAACAALPAFARAAPAAQPDA